MLFPLDMLRAGERAEIAEVSGDPAWVGRLSDLGVRQGCPICVVQPGSPCLLEVGGMKLCLRGGECSQIFVRPLPKA
jgi:Fe2+ transport system protein FeoA